MELIAWDENKIIGIEEIDNDHRHLIGLINTYHEARGSGKSLQVLSGLLAQLKEYSREHFKREEAYMLNTAHPHYRAHRAQHLDFMRQVAEFENEYREDKAFLAIRIMPFMMSWLIDHIMTTDMMLRPQQ